MIEKMDEGSVAVPLSRYQRMKRNCEWLEILEAAGVDNWEGMDEAIRIAKEWGFYKKWDEDEDDDEN